MVYWASQQVIGRDFSENYPGVATLASAVGSRAGWLGYEGTSKSKHTKAFPKSCCDAKYMGLVLLGMMYLSIQSPPPPLSESVWMCAYKLIRLRTEQRVITDVP